MLKHIPMLLFSSLIFSNVFAGELEVEGKVLRTVLGVDILDTSEVGSAKPVKLNSEREYGGGVLIGRPVKFSYKGVVFETYELEINQGGFTDSSLYIGAVIDASTDDQTIFEKFKGLDQNTQYIFAYKYIFPMDPEIEGSHLQITDIYTVEEYVKLKKLKTIPSSVVTKYKYQGSISNGSDNDRSGRIVDVERFGLLGDFCTVELNLGGVRNSGGHGSSEALLLMTVLDEDVCSYAESILPLAQDVHVNYSEDWWEIWSPTSRFANGIKLSTGQGAQDETSFKAKAFVATNRQDLEEIKRSLLNDPEFLKQIADKISKRQQQR